MCLSAGGNNIGKVTSKVHRRCRACLERIHGPGMAAGSVGCLTASKHPASGFPVHLQRTVGWLIIARALDGLRGKLGQYFIAGRPD